MPSAIELTEETIKTLVRDNAIIAQDQLDEFVGCFLVIDHGAGFKPYRVIDPLTFWTIWKFTGYRNIERFQPIEIINRKALMAYYKKEIK